MSESTAIRSLRIAIVTEWLLIIGGLLVSFAFEDSLPPELQTYLAIDQPLSSVIESMAFAALFGSVVASVGLWFLRAWARPIYVGTFLCLSIIVALGEPSVSTGQEAALSELSILVAGFVIGVAYFGGIKNFSAQQAIPTDRPKTGSG